MSEIQSKTVLYKKLADTIKKDITSGIIAPGSKLPSENELAKKYNISRLTARQAITLLVNEGIVERYHGKGSFCKAITTLKKIDVLLDMSDYYFIPYYMQSIGKVLEENGATFIAADTKNKWTEVLKLLSDIAERGSDGIILLASPEKDYVRNKVNDVFKKLKEKNIPCIQIDTCYDISDISRVIMDEEEMGYLAAKHFKDMGHTKLALVYYENNILSDMRMKAFYEFFDDITEINYFDSAMEQQIKKAYESGISGIFCYSDFMAIKVIEILNTMNLKIPEDISLITVDDTPVSQIYYITSVEHAKGKIGEFAAKCILSGNMPKEKVFKPKLVTRKSVLNKNHK